MISSKCDRCGEVATDIDAGFSPGLHEMKHDCGGTWRVHSSSMGRSLMPKPMPRDEFDGLIERRRGLEHATRELHVALTVARARGVEPVTVETLNTTQTMSLGLYARQIRREDLIAACEAWHVRRDPAARALIINYLNEEARPQ